MKKSLSKHLSNPFVDGYKITELINISYVIITPDHELCKRNQIRLHLQRQSISKLLTPVPGPLKDNYLRSLMKIRNLKKFNNLFKPIEHRSNQLTIEVKEERSLLTRFNWLNNVVQI